MNEFYLLFGNGALLDGYEDQQQAMEILEFMRGWNPENLYWLEEESAW